MSSNTLNRDNQLREDGEDLIFSFLEQLLAPIHGQELVGLLDFSQSFEEDRQVEMIV